MVLKNVIPLAGGWVVSTTLYSVFDRWKRICGT